MPLCTGRHDDAASHGNLRHDDAASHEYLAPITQTSAIWLQVFVPPKKAEHPPDFNIHDYPLGRFAFIFVTLTMGWPAYLFFNVTGRPYKSRWVNHFDPYSEIFSKRERVEV